MHQFPECGKSLTGNDGVNLCPDLGITVRKRRQAFGYGLKIKHGSAGKYRHLSP